MRVMPIEILHFAEAVKRTMETLNIQYSLYTDGSYQQDDLPWEAVLQTKSANRRVGRASAAIVAIACSDNWKDQPIHVLYLSQTEQFFEIQSYEAELIALMAAIHVAVIVPELEIFSDCQAAISTVKESHSKSSKKNQLCHVRPIVKILENFDRLPRIQWIRSHPEERLKNRSLWQKHDWGSYVADAAAKGQMRQLVQQFITATENVSSTSLDRVATGLIPPGTWYWRKEDFQLPILHSTIKFHSERRSQKYFSDRDADRVHRGQEERWKGSSLALAARCWKKVASGTLGSNIALKNCLDKYYHGRNRAKGLVGMEAERMLECHVCKMPDSQKHIILECKCEGLAAIREEALEQMLEIAGEEIEKHGKTSKYIARVVRFVADNAFANDYQHYDRLWTGLWNADVLHCGLTYKARDGELFPDTLPFEVINLIQDSIARVTAPLTQALRSIMQTHRKASEDEVERQNPKEKEEENSQKDGSCKSDDLQTGSQLRSRKANTVTDESLTDTDEASRQRNCNSKKESRRRKQNYGRKCIERRKRKHARSNRNDNSLRELSQELSESCRVVVESLVRREGSVAESVSHPSGATRFRDYDCD